MTSISPVRLVPVQAPRPAEAPPAAPAPRPPLPNPSLRLEPSLGVVVFEVRDAAGEVVRSVPTERELKAYRTAALRGGEPAASGEKPQPPGRQAEGGEGVDPRGLLPRA
jgi:hypothetical protein